MIFPFLFSSSFCPYTLPCPFEALYMMAEEEEERIFRRQFFSFRFFMGVQKRGNINDI
jgi:hypothetical protein